MSTTGYPLDNADLIGTMCESVLYGGAVIATAATVRNFMERAALGGSVHWIFRAAPWLLILVATLHIVVDWYRNLHAFLVLSGREERILFLVDITRWSYSMKDALFGVQAWVGDLIIIYRCYMVCGQDWKIVVIPGLSYLITLASSMTSIALEAEANSIFIGRLLTSISISFSSMVLTTAFCTLAIVYRLLIAQRGASPIGRPSGLKHVAGVILQSGLIYSVTLLVVLTLEQLQNNLQTIPFNCMCPLIALLFNNITNITRQPIEHNGTSNSIFSRPMFPRSSQRRFTMSNRGGIVSEFDAVELSGTDGCRDTATGTFTTSNLKAPQLA